MENIVLFFIAPLLTLPLMFYAFKSKLSNGSKSNLPPGSFGWPIIGETFAFLNETQEKFVGDRMKKHSPKVFKTYILGEPTAVFCGNSGHKFIASNEEKLFLSWRPQSTQKLFRSSYQKVASKHTPRVDTVHVKSSPGFLKTEALVQHTEKMDSMVQQHLKLHWDGKSSVEVYDLAQLLDDPERTAKFAKFYNVITSGLHTIPLNVPGTAFHRAMKAANATRKEVLLLVMEKKAAVSSSTSEIKINDIMSHLLFNPDPRGQFMTENEVADRVMGLMAGGFHSPSMATTFLIKFLGERPDICDKVRTEQLEIARSKKSGEALNWEDIQKMKYSWSVALEVMRLVPPLQGTFREVITDFTYEGYTIPKGWKNFAAPEEFDPSRFENGNPPPPYSNIPFGSGPRICPGIGYARLQILCFLHHVVTRYKWEVLNTSAKIAGGLNPVPEGGVHIRLHPYTA
ncbi:unnamed protein product [Malus baccata var. baccata]